jgi:hypothetical protein
VRLASGGERCGVISLDLARRQRLTVVSQIHARKDAGPHLRRRNQMVSAKIGTLPHCGS